MYAYYPKEEICCLVWFCAWCRPFSFIVVLQGSGLWEWNLGHSKPSTQKSEVRLLTFCCIVFVHRLYLWGITSQVFRCEKCGLLTWLIIILVCCWSPFTPQPSLEGQYFKICLISGMIWLGEWSVRKCQQLVQHNPWCGNKYKSPFRPRYGNNSNS